MKSYSMTSLRCCAFFIDPCYCNGSPLLQVFAPLNSLSVPANSKCSARLLVLHTGEKQRPKEGWHRRWLVEITCLCRGYKHCWKNWTRDAARDPVPGPAGLWSKTFWKGADGDMNSAAGPVRPRPLPCVLHITSTNASHNWCIGMAPSSLGFAEWQKHQGHDCCPDICMGWDFFKGSGLLETSCRLPHTVDLFIIVSTRCTAADDGV